MPRSRKNETPEVLHWRATIGANVRCAREGAGLSQGALARAVGVTRPAITRIESGVGFPSVEGLYRIAKACGCHPGMLLVVEEPGLQATDLIQSALTLLR